MYDPFNEFGVFFINLYFVCIFLKIIYYPYDWIINKYLFNSFFLSNGISELLHLLGFTFTDNTYQLFLVFFVLYLILYGFYLIIIYIIPKTGFETLFIPARELLLAIPPLPLLINKGVFRMFDNLFGFLSGFVKFNNFFINYYEYSRSNILEYIRFFNPNIDLLIEGMKNGNNNNNDNDNNNDKSDVDVCTNSQTEITTPDMNFVDLFINQMKNTKTSVKCNLNSIKSYIKTSANDAKTDANDSVNHMND